MMTTIIRKAAGKDGGCDLEQLAKRGWRNVDDGEAREPTCISMLPPKNKHDVEEKEIWVPIKYIRKRKVPPPTKEELERLTRLFIEEPDKLGHEESYILTHFLPFPEFEALIKKKCGVKFQKTKAVVNPTPFVYEDGGDGLHNCRICGKKDHGEVNCAYWNFIPLGASVGPEYVVKCHICSRRISQPVGVCQYCGSEGGVADLKVCVICFRYGDHVPEECPIRNQKQNTLPEEKSALQNT